MIETPNGKKSKDTNNINNKNLRNWEVTRMSKTLKLSFVKYNKP